MKCLLLLIVAIACANAGINKNVLVEEWKSFKMMHSKSYANRAEESKRYGIYMENSLLIAKHNQKYAMNEVSYTMGLNEFSDMTSEEFLETMTTPVFDNEYVLLNQVS